MTHAFTIKRAELRTVHLPLLTPFVISTGTMTHKTFPLLILEAVGITGIAEGVMDPLPDYLEETTAGALDLLRTAVLPKLVGMRIASPTDIAPLLAPWRGNRMAKAVAEMAVWDLWARSLGLPLCALLGGVRDRIEVGVSLGIAPLDVTLDRIAEAQAQGYRRIKLKIKQGHDLALLAGVRTHPPNSYNPFVILTHEYVDIWNDMKKSKNWYHKFMYAFAAPGWSHDGSSLTIKQQRKLLRKQENELVSS